MYSLVLSRIVKYHLFYFWNVSNINLY